LLENLPWNRARIKFVTRFLLALYAVQTVNLSILATAFSGHAKEASNYKRLQRALSASSSCLMPNSPHSWSNCSALRGHIRWRWIARTGESGPSRSTFCCSRSSTAGPASPSSGWSCPRPATRTRSSARRSSKSSLTCSARPTSRVYWAIASSSADARFRFLKQRRIKFQMPLKKDTQVKNARGQFVSAWRWFAATRVNQMRVIPAARQMWGMELFLSGCYLGDGE
jgi:hypothetical protein